MSSIISKMNEKCSCCDDRFNYTLENLKIDFEGIIKRIQKGINNNDINELITSSNNLTYINKIVWNYVETERLIKNVK